MLQGNRPPTYLVYFDATAKLDPNIEAELDRESIDLSGSTHVHAIVAKNRNKYKLFEICPLIKEWRVSSFRVGKHICIKDSQPTRIS